MTAIPITHPSLAHLREVPEGHTVQVIGLLEQVTHRETARLDPWATAVLRDRGMEIELHVYPRIFSKTAGPLRDGLIVHVVGRIDRRTESPIRLIATSVQPYGMDPHDDIAELAPYPKSADQVTAAALLRYAVVTSRVAFGAFGRSMVAARFAEAGDAFAAAFLLEQLLQHAGCDAADQAAGSLWEALNSSEYGPNDPINVWTDGKLAEYGIQPDELAELAIVDDLDAMRRTPRVQELPISWWDGLVRVFKDVARERASQIEKWGDAHLTPDFEWNSIAGEEAGEAFEALLLALGRVAREVNESNFEAGHHHGDWARLREELVQLAAVVIAWLEDIDQREVRALGTYLVWSNTEQAWQGDGTFTTDLWQARRFTHGQAMNMCSRRTPAGADPHEVMVLAPEDGRRLTLTAIRCAAELMELRIANANDAATAARKDPITHG